MLIPRCQEVSNRIDEVFDAGEGSAAHALEGTGRSAVSRGPDQAMILLRLLRGLSGDDALKGIELTPPHFILSTHGRGVFFR